MAEVSDWREDTRIKLSATSKRRWPGCRSSLKAFDFFAIKKRPRGGVSFAKNGICLGDRFALQHDDLSRADVFQHFEFVEQMLHRIDFVRVAGNLNDHRAFRHIYGCRLEVVAVLENFGSLLGAALDLDQGEFLFHGFGTGVILGLNYVHELFELLDNLNQNFRVSVRNDVHAAEVGVQSRRNDEGVQIVATAGKYEGDAHQDARTVGDE